MDVIKKIVIGMEIARKLNEQLEQSTTTKQEYSNDSVDLSIPKIETFQFVECDKYMTVKGLNKFNLDYVIERIKGAKILWVTNWTQKAIDENPEIPINEIRWYFCALEVKAYRLQINYYYHWMKYNENDKVSVEEISDIIKKGWYDSADEIYKLLIKYNLTTTAFIWDILGNVFSQVRDKYDLLKKLKVPRT
jgi:hypothetical protein